VPLPMSEKATVVTTSPPAPNPTSRMLRPLESFRTSIEATASAGTATVSPSHGCAIPLLRLDGRDREEHPLLAIPEIPAAQDEGIRPDRAGELLRPRVGERNRNVRPDLGTRRSE